MSKKYKVILTEEQMRVIQKACEMYFRLMMGQDMDFSDEIAAINTDLSTDNPNHDKIFNSFISRKNHIREVMKSVFRIAFEPCGYLDHKTADLMIAECIWNAVRFARGDNHWHGLRPYAIGPEPVPKIEVMEEEGADE